MEKARIMIVDFDFSYVAVLQNKFIVELFDEFELAVITEVQIFNQFLRSNFCSDLLIIDEKLLVNELNLERFGHIVVLTQNGNETHSKEGNIVHISRKTSVNILFSEIIGELTDSSLNVKTKCRTRSKIIPVISATGGTGKTTVSMGVCLNLAKDLQKVLYINASSLQCCQLCLEDRNIFPDSVLEKIKDCEDNLIYDSLKPYICENVFNYVPIFDKPIIFKGITKKFFNRVALSARSSREYDYIILDMETSEDYYFKDLLNVSDGVILVMEPSRHSLKTTKKLFENFLRSTNIKNFIICNKVNGKSQIEKSDIIKELKIDVMIDESEELRNPDLTQFHKNSAFKSIVRKIELML